MTNTSNEGLKEKRNYQKDIIRELKEMEKDFQADRTFLRTSQELASPPPLFLVT
jgi:hypothetical protein